MRIAISIFKPGIYSETFIRHGIEKIPGDKTVFHGKPLPNFSDREGCFYPSGSFITRWSTKLKGKIRGWSPHRQLLHELEIRFRGYDVVLAHYGTMGAEILPACRAARVPLVTHFHGMDAHRESTLDANRAKYEELAQYGSRFIAVSNSMVESLKRLGFPQEKIVYCPYGVDLSNFSTTRADANPPRFLAVGRFVDKKAPFLTLLAFHKVFQDCPESRLVMAGDGALLSATQELASQLGLNEVVTFTGAIPHEQIAALMRDSRGFVQHSVIPRIGEDKGDSEGLPNAILEAAACGLPVVSTRHAGICEAVVDGETGFLVNERDVEGMASSMKTLALNPQLALQMGSRARLHAEQYYSLDTYTDTLTGILRDANRAR